MKKSYLLLLIVSCLLFSCSGDGDDMNVPLQSIEINKESFKLLKGNTEALYLKLTPDNASDIEAEWTSSDENIATVEYGVVTGVALGKATITAVVDGKKSVCEVEVHEIFTNKTGTDVEIGVGDKEELLVVQTQEGYNVNEIVWTTEDGSVVTVERKIIGEGASDAQITIAKFTGVITGVGAGTTKITATVKGVEYISNFWPTPFESTVDINVTCK